MKRWTSLLLSIVLIGAFSLPAMAAQPVGHVHDETCAQESDLIHHCDDACEHAADNAARYAAYALRDQQNEAAPAAGCISHSYVWYFYDQYYTSPDSTEAIKACGNNSVLVTVEREECSKCGATRSGNLKSTRKIMLTHSWSAWSGGKRTCSKCKRVEYQTR